MINKTKAISYNNRAYFFWALFAVSMISLFVYIYAVNTIARNISTIQNIERRATKISADLGPLEFAYIELKNSITMEMARNYGFQEVKNPLYVSRAPSASLTFNTLSR